MWKPLRPKVGLSRPLCKPKVLTHDAQDTTIKSIPTGPEVMDGEVARKPSVIKEAVEMDQCEASSSAVTGFTIDGPLVTVPPKSSNPSPSSSSLDPPEAQQPKLGRAFKTPFLNKRPPSPPKDQPAGEGHRYFHALWTKDLKKKHKHYCDGVLCVTPRRYTLQDGEGRMVTEKMVGRTNPDLQPDMVLQVGTCEVEVGTPITSEEYASGCCFVAPPSIITNSNRTSVVSKGFTNAARKRKRTQDTDEGKPEVELHPTTGEAAAEAKGTRAAVERQEVPKGSLLLNEGHAACDDQGRPIMDVWLDPFLARCLREHQVQGLQFLYDCVSGQGNAEAQGCILADEMGLGKTLTSICLIWVMLKRGPQGVPMAKKVIVVAPSSLVQNWAKEIGKWLGSTRLDPLVVMGDRKEVEGQFQDFRAGYKPLLITSYDLCRSHTDLLQNCRCDLLICDEGHRLKNDNTKIARALSRLSCTRRVLLTGTPLQNDLQELYTLMNFIAPGLLGSRDAFRNLYTDCIAKSREPGASIREQELGRARQEELSRRTQPFLLRRTADILKKQLPPRTELLIFCRLSALQLNLYQHFLRSKALSRLLANANDSSLADALTCITTLRKILAHPSTVYRRGANEGDEEWAQKLEYFPPDFKAEDCDPLLSGKLQFLQVLLQEVRNSTHDKVVLVSNSTQTLDVIEHLVKTEKYQYLRLDGATPTGRRMSIVEQLNNPSSRCSLLLLSSKAGGVGLNLVGANRIVLFDPDWNPANDVQAMARVWREGQRKEVFIYRLFSTGTIEEKILQRQHTKDGLSRLVVDESKGHCRCHWGKDELRRLFYLNLTDSCETFRDEASGFDPSVAMEGIDPVLHSALQRVSHVSFVKQSKAEVLLEIPTDAEEAFGNDSEDLPCGSASNGIDSTLLIPCDDMADIASASEENGQGECATEMKADSDDDKECAPQPACPVAVDDAMDVEELELDDAR